MKTYSVTFDMKESCTNCVKVNRVATYAVSADAQQTFFNVLVEANSNEEALIVATLHISKFIMGRAYNQIDKVRSMAMEEYQYEI